jgi:hypothetical protein
LTSQRFALPGAGSLPKKVWSHLPLFDTRRMIHLLSAPKRTRFVPATSKAWPSLAMVDQDVVACTVSKGAASSASLPLPPQALSAAQAAKRDAICVSRWEV